MKGSEWRRWDLHVHTASSEDYKYKQTDADQKLVDAWRTNEIEAVAITDHFLIDADRIKNLKALAPEITIFPGVELRTDKGSSNIHVIIIFSENIDLDILKADFDAIMLRQKAKGVGVRADSDFETIYWDYTDIVNFAREKFGVISIHAGSKSNGVDQEISNKDFFKMAIKSEYAQSVKIYEVGNLKTLKEYTEIVLPVIGERPVIICSDNHDPRNYNFLGKLWIKAETTFTGLVQAIEHSKERIFVGEEPIKKYHERSEPQYIIEAIEIKKNDTAKNSEEWFESKIELNSSLVTIIGNKGSGKSALSDILGLIGNSANIKNEFASFLNDTRFNRLPKNFGKDYLAKLTWLDGHIDEVSTLEIIDKIETSKVQYLPQKYIENVCSNLDDDFQNEINKVLYSYLDSTEKLDTRNFNEFIEKKTQAIKLEIAAYKEKIKEINLKIIVLEKKKSKAYLDSHINRLNELQEELRRQLELKPMEVEKPNTEEDLSFTKKIEEIDKELEVIQDEIDNATKDIKLLHKHKNEVETLITKVNLESVKIQKLNTEIVNGLSSFIEDHEKYLFKYSSPSEILTQLLNQLTDEINCINAKLISEVDTSLNSKKNLLNVQKQQLIQESNGATQNYQKYVNELKAWEIKVNKIKDDNASEDTISYIEKEIGYIKQKLDIEYLQAINDRKILIESIYNEKKKIISMYNEIYSPIDSELRPVLNDLDNGITFAANLTLTNFADDVLALINKQHASVFNGKENSQVQIQSLIKKIDIDNFNSIYEFIESVINGCKVDNDFDKLEKVIRDKNRFYELLCELEYIKVDYSLTLYGKELSQLSPGERGLVLLIFYLVLSKDKQPIIIDQPEDNLDNQSIYSKLVPCIREAKKTRQVIIVTHNPNIAVACDSEQIIVANIDKVNNKISYISGSLEDESLNSNIIDILEGTIPAFDLRDRKYIFRK